MLAQSRDVYSCTHTTLVHNLNHYAFVGCCFKWYLGKLSRTTWASAVLIHESFISLTVSLESEVSLNEA
jgi:hypothetical protein